MKYFFLSCSLFFTALLFGQNKPSIPTVKQKKVFVKPIKIPMVLSGTFGEWRSSHFHSGIDIKTQQKEGFPIHSIADGFVSRIKISHWGYGKALYVTHPNGYTSVYAHLQKFNPKIEAFVKKRQYQKQSYEIQLFPNKDQLVLKQDEIIAYSGSTGGYVSPHLHFEIRDTKTEAIINPLKFGYEIPDHKFPKFYRLQIHPITATSQVEGLNKKQLIPLVKNKNKYNASPVRVHGKVGLSVQVFDKLDHANNNNGIYELNVFVNEISTYHLPFDRFYFTDSKFIKIMKDYEKWTKNNQTFQKTFVHPLNNFSAVQTDKKMGVIDIVDGKKYHIRIEASDYAGNKSQINFDLLGVKATANISKQTFKSNFSYLINKNTVFKTEEKDFKVIIPANSLYDDELIDIKYENQKLHVHRNSIPLRKALSLQLQMPSNTLGKPNQYYIAELVKSKAYPLKTQLKNGYLEAKSKTFGTYTIKIDSLAPKVLSSNLNREIKPEQDNHIWLKVKDQETSISKYTAKIDGKWALMEYNLKKNKLLYNLKDMPLKKGKHLFELELQDFVGNKTKYEVPFYID